MFRFMDKPVDHPLKTWREARGLKPAQAAAQVPVAGVTWGRWEKRQRQPQGEELESLIKLTGLTAGQILEMGA
jgi:DNA-binding transcriptional regulator YiaG